MEGIKRCSLLPGFCQKSSKLLFIHVLPPWKPLVGGGLVVVVFIAKIPFSREM